MSQIDARTSIAKIDPFAPLKDVVAAAAKQRIIARATPDPVERSSASDHIVALATSKSIVIRLAEDEVVASSTS